MMSEGKRITQEYCANKGYFVDTEDLARRIDAALAERDVVFECPACGLVKGRTHDLHLLQEKLAEREAQIAYLVSWIRCDHHQPQPPSFVCSHTRDKLDALTTAARAFVERIQAAERERCAQIADVYIAAAIRALGPKGEK